LVTCWRVLNDLHSADLVALGDNTTLRLDSSASSVRAPRHGIEFAIAWFVSVARKTTGIDVVPVSVTFEHTAPEQIGEPARIFPCPLTFDAPARAIVFDRKTLTLPSTARDPDLVVILERHAAGLLAKLPTRTGFVASVRAAALPLLSTGDATAERVAKAL